MQSIEVRVDDGYSSDEDPCIAFCIVGLGLVSPEAKSEFLNNRPCDCKSFYCSCLKTEAALDLVESILKSIDLSGDNLDKKEE